MNDEYDPTRPFQPSDSDADLDWEDDEGSPKLLWGRVLALAGILLLAFLLGRATAPDDSAEDIEQLKDQLARAQETIEQLEGEIPTVPPTSPAPSISTTPGDEPDDEPSDEPTDEETEGEGKVKSYTVQPGDTFVSIAEKEFGDVTPGMVDCLVEANGGEEVLSVGDDIQIPEDCADE